MKTSDIKFRNIDGTYDFRHIENLIIKCAILDCDSTFGIACIIPAGDNNERERYAPLCLSIEQARQLQNELNRLLPMTSAAQEKRSPGTIEAIVFV